MEAVSVIVTIALFQFIYFSFQVGRARQKYGVKAPANTGHPVFERYHRIQQNTLEQLIIFLPGVFMFSILAERAGWAGYEMAGAAGLVWIAGRFIYYRAYLADPDKRALGFILTLFPSVMLLGGALAAAVISLV